MKCYQANHPVLARVWARIERRFAGYPPALRRLSRQFWKTLGRGPREFFSATHSPPLLHLPVWLAQGRQVSLPLEVLEATALLYFYVRIQDNVVDEPMTRGKAPLLLLGNVFLSDAISLLARLPLSQQFWSRARDAWQVFSDATEAERHQVFSSAPYPAVLFRKHARKVALARIPLYAVLDGADSATLRAVDRFIDRLGEAYGLVNDVLGMERDLAAGTRTYLIATADRTLQGNKRRDLKFVRRAILASPYMENFLEQAMRLHRRILGMGHRLGFAKLDVFTEERILQLKELMAKATALRLAFALAAKV